MELEINGKIYEFKFGVRFVREVDKEMPVERDGMKFGVGLAARVIPELQSGNISTLSKVLYLASRTEKEKLSQSELDDYVDDCDDIEKLFDKVLEELAESNAGKLAMKEFKKKLK